ncbi:MAG TPA: hypothetical protein VM223_10870 [Planctomycetota bacterium]|nr:hypothetical protein [Planctomycetota bacterium]
MRITNAMIQRVKQMGAEGCRHRDIADRVGISRGVVRLILRGVYRTKEPKDQTGAGRRAELKAREALAKRRRERGMELPDPRDREIDLDLDLDGGAQERYLELREIIRRQRRLCAYNDGGG